MAKQKITIDIDEVMQDDALEARQSAAQSNKRKSMRRKKRIRFILLLSIVATFFIYIFSDYSNIRIIDVNGNKIYTKEKIMEMADIDYSMKSIFAPAFLIERKLKKDVLIKDVDVHKTLDGTIRIDISEEETIGYYSKKDKTYMMFKEGEDVLIEDTSLLVHVPYISTLSKEQRKQYKKNLKNVSIENIWMVSEIVHYETTYDKNMLKLYMQDGHVVKTTMEGLKMLNNYLEMLKALNTNHKCITFVEETNSSYSEKCE